MEAIKRYFLLLLLEFPFCAVSWTGSLGILELSAPVVVSNLFRTGYVGCSLKISIL